MFIVHKSKILHNYSMSEIEARTVAKGLNKEEYVAWFKTVQDEKTGEVDYSGESGYTLIEIVDENIEKRISTLREKGYVKDNIDQGTTIYNIKWQDDIGDAEEIFDADKGKSLDPKAYVQSHLIPDDAAKAARENEEMWTEVRRLRDRKLSETDWMANSDVSLSSAWKTYRQKLRDVPKDNESITDISKIELTDKQS